MTNAEAARELREMRDEQDTLLGRTEAPAQVREALSHKGETMKYAWHCLRCAVSSARRGEWRNARMRLRWAVGWTR